MKKTGKYFAFALIFTLSICAFFATNAAAEDDIVRINFQTKGSETPEGFLADNGDPYGDRGNGYTYGWRPGNIGNARDYSLIESDVKLATLNQFGEGFFWEIEIPNGTYEVTVSIGDIQYPNEIKGKLLLMAEDAVVFQNEEVDGRWLHVKPSSEVYASNTVKVEVKDGKLTLDPKDSARKNIKINYIEIKSLSGTIGDGSDDSDSKPGTPSNPGVEITPGYNIKLFVNGNEIESDVQPVLVNGRTMLPIRSVAESLDADVVWNKENNAVLINSMPSQTKAKTDTIQLVVNGLVITPDVPPFLLNGRTMVPIRFASEALGLDVKWDQQNQTVHVNSSSIPEPSNELIGWASVSDEGLDGTTGGGDAAPQVVTTREEFAALAGDDTPRVIVVSGTISSGVEPIRIGSNKTIVGEDKYATIHGGITIDHASNVIIRNLNFQGTWPIFGPNDTIAARYSHHLWFDHLNIWDAGDGLLDVTQGTNYVTISWSKFFYTDPDHPHRLASLNGGGAEHEDTDIGKNKVTYHHNWFANHVNQRMPRVLFGEAHVFNNYYTPSDNSYAIGVGVYASVLVENNYFQDVRNPHQFMYPDRRPAYITAEGNIYDNTRGSRDSGGVTPEGYKDVQPFTEPPYEYNLDDAKDVPLLVKRFAGPQ